MTALGLVTAVPAVLAYNWLQRRNKSIAEDLSAVLERRARLPRIGRRGSPGEQSPQACFASEAGCDGDRRRQTGGVPTRK